MNTPSINFESLYHNDYFQLQYNKFQKRKTNHWAKRINYTFETLEQLPLAGKKVLDLGTSVGTYAFEFASRGYEAYGIDLSPEAIGWANKIAKENNIKVQYKIGDISESSNYPESTFDMIYAGDIIEHLMNDTLEKTIKNCNHWLKPDGYFLFHTIPTRYDKVFHKSYLWIPLIPFALLSDHCFKKTVESYYIFFNQFLKLLTGKSWIEREQETVHCNLQTRENILNLLQKANFKEIQIQLKIMEDRFKKKPKFSIFKNKEFFQKDIFGCCIK